MKTKENKRDVVAATEINTIRCGGVIRRPVSVAHKMTDMHKWMSVRVREWVWVWSGGWGSMRERRPNERKLKD